MQQNTKQRILGTIVLLALALIFLPIVFDGQGSYQTPISSRIPDPPEVLVLPEPVQSRPVIVADSLPPAVAEPVAETAQPAEPERPDSSSVADSTTDIDDAPPPAAVTASEPDIIPESPALGPDGLPQGWSVRLGLFSDSANADNLLQRLQDAGYRAYTRAVSNELNDLTGVFVGPWLDRARVDEYQRTLQNQFQLDGIVVPYEITQ